MRKRKTPAKVWQITNAGSGFIELGLAINGGFENSTHMRILQYLKQNGPANQKDIPLEIKTNNKSLKLLQRRCLISLVSEGNDAPKTPLEEYRQKYAGLTRSQVRRIDSELFDRLTLEDLLQVPPDKYHFKRKPKNKAEYGDDPLKYYWEHCYGLRGRKLYVEHHRLYEKLRLYGLLEKLPSKYANPLEYYERHFTGLTRGQLHKVCRGLYDKLYSDGLLDKIPRKRLHFGDNPLEYYERHFEGLTRGQLEKKCVGLYNRLRRDGLLDKIPLRASMYKEEQQVLSAVKAGQPFEYRGKKYVPATDSKEAENL